MLVICCFAICKKPVRPNNYGLRATGVSARDLLTADSFTRMEVEVNCMPGARLEDKTTDNLADFINGMCDKPDGIKITRNRIEGAAITDTLTLAQVIELENKYRTVYMHGNTIAVHILVTNGYASNSLIAGLAYHNTSIVLYGKAISGSYSGNEQQTFVLQHEIGHLVGLVNSNTPMVRPHEDSLHVHHCSNPACVMNYGSGSTRLDTSCIRDLMAMRRWGVTRKSNRFFRRKQKQ